MFEFPFKDAKKKSGCLAIKFFFFDVFVVVIIINKNIWLPHNFFFSFVFIYKNIARIVILSFFSAVIFFLLPNNNHKSLFFFDKVLKEKKSFFSKFNFFNFWKQKKNLIFVCPRVCVCVWFIHSSVHPLIMDHHRGEFKSKKKKLCILFRYIILNSVFFSSSFHTMFIVWEFFFLLFCLVINILHITKLLLFASFLIVFFFVCVCECVKIINEKKFYQPANHQFKI